MDDSDRLAIRTPLRLAGLESPLSRIMIRHWEATDCIGSVDHDGSIVWAYPTIPRDEQERYRDRIRLA